MTISPTFDTLAVGSVSGDFGAGTAIAAGASAALSQSDRANLILNAQDFGGGVWTSSTDAAPYIQAAINYAASLPNGAIIRLPRGQFNLGSALTISNSNVSLEAEGHGGLLRNNLSPTTKIYGTRFIWTGSAGATMLTVSPPTDIVSGVQIAGNVVKGILLDCAGVAATAALFASVYNGWIDIAAAEPTGSGVIFDTAQIATGNSLQNNDIWVSVVNRTGTGAAVVFDATGNVTVAQGNVSLNRFHAIRIIHKDGDGLVSNHSDNNTIAFLNVQSLNGSGGNCVILNGTSSTLAPVGSDSNTIIFYSANGQFLAKGTDAGFTTPSQSNAILHLDTANSTPEPTVGTGATMYWRRATYNVWSSQGCYQGDFAPNADQMTKLKGVSAVDPLRVYASSQTGILLGARAGGLDSTCRFYIDPDDFICKFITVSNVNGFQIGSTNAPLTLGGLPRQSTTDSITAHAGGGQANATALTTTINRVATVATAADSVKLPTSAAGMVVTVINSGANACQVFGNNTATINGVASGTGVSLASGKTAVYSCVTAGAWFGGALT